MKRTIFAAAVITILAALPVSAQSKLCGDWEGRLNAGPKNIRILLHVKPDSAAFRTLLDSPDQGAVNLPMASTEIIADTLIIRDAKSAIEIRGALRKDCDSLSADFIQRGFRIPISFGRTSVKGFSVNRPQTPKPPYPYKSEEVTFINKHAGNIKLAGTLTIPDNVKNPPVVITISGSGPQNRDEKLFNHEPFHVLADHLGRNGIAVLRFDDRGVGASEGNFKAATSFDFSTDAEAAVEFLMSRGDVDVNKIGLFGHSEGGLIAPMVAVRNNNVKFIICLAGPAIASDRLLLKQIADIAASEKVSMEEISREVSLNSEIFAAIKTDIKQEVLENRMREILTKHNHAEGKKEAHDAYVKKILTPWFRYFITYDPAPVLEKVKCPLLALNGDLDTQVNAEMNLEAMRESLKKADNKDFTLVYLKGINHAGQEAITGGVSEYAMIEQTLSPKVLNTISEWINKRF